MLKKTILIVICTLTFFLPAMAALPKIEYPAIVCFFASWSKTCQEEIKFLNEIYPDCKKSGINLVLVSFDRKSEELTKYINENKIEVPLIHDKKLDLIKEYKILIIPTTLIIDKDGKVVKTYIEFDKNIKENLLKQIHS